jgi:hypothetical protein
MLVGGSRANVARRHPHRTPAFRLRLLSIYSRLSVYDAAYENFLDASNESNRFTC